MHICRSAPARCCRRAPWDDRSGERLRGWMGIGAETLYDRDRVAILPMD
jgi:hypothetical protein